MKKIILSLIIGLLLTGCTASKKESITVDAKVSEAKKATASSASDDSSEEEGDDECMDEDE